MAITLYHHPYSRAANAVWMLEELGVDYTLEYVDIKSGAQKDPAFLALNPMGKLPTIDIDGVVLTESAAIGLYLADRFSLGTLAPTLDDPARATYYRWILYGPSVIEPACYAHNAKWDYRPGAAGWGTYEAMLATCEHAIGEGPYVLGDRFTMADICFGGTLAYMLQFGLIDKRDRFQAYAARIEEREARARSNEINQRVMREHGLQVD